MSGPLAEQLERARYELLDLTARNRLLNTPLTQGRSTRLDLIGESSSEAFRVLVQDRRELSFRPAAKSSKSGSHSREEDTGGLADDASEEFLHISQPLEPEEQESGGQKRSVGQQLQTALDDEKLQTRLLRLFYDARSMFEEQGVNSLFLAMGFLEWYESPSSDKARFAPLLLIPVELHRRTVNARFRLKVLEEEITTNLSLQAKLKVDFRLGLPEVPDLEELDPGEYFTAVERMISDQPRWRVHRDRMTLWFFSFAKFLMFRDLDPDVWPEGKRPSDHPLVSGLLGEPIVFEPPLIRDDEPLDERLDPRSTCHVVDCDSSQAAAIEEVRAGRNLVIQGPPGTGKSQSIANLIASAVRDGKSVLFVAEKMAALDVVKSRLDAIGLGDICLELHSHKANRRAVLDDLGNTLDLGRPTDTDVAQQAVALAQTRNRLNEYVNQLHTPVQQFGRTPFELIGRLCQLQVDGIKAFDCEIPEICGWSESTLLEKQSLLRDIADHLQETGTPCQHPWYGMNRTTHFLPSDLESLVSGLKSLCDGLQQMLEHGQRLSRLLNIVWKSEEASFQSIQRLVQFVSKLRSIPEMDRTAFANLVWTEQRDEITRIIERGRELKRCRHLLQGVLSAVAWQTDVTQVRIDLAGLGRSLFRWFHRHWWRAMGTLRGIAEHPCPKQLDDQLRALDLLMLGQACLADLQRGGAMHPIGLAAFGRLWKEGDSDWDQLASIAAWEAACRAAAAPKAFRQVIANWTDREGTVSTLADLLDASRRTWGTLRETLKTLDIEVGRSFGGERLAEIPLTQFLTRFAAWQNAVPQLGRWVLLQRRLRELSTAGLGALQSQIEQGQINDLRLERLELMFCEAAMRRALEERHQIAMFDGISQMRMVEEFRVLDQERIRLARCEVASAHFDRLPVGGDHGEVGLIRGEIRKKRKHWALRRLLADAGHAVQAIKPVFMMSPISVAQFLKPGGLTFDLLVIDEASQVRPVEALGAVLRCRRAVVVGDNRQLPPTAFFDRAVGAEDDVDESDGTAVADVESILDLCLARNFPQRMLRWHYRSRHHSLIAVSNREFYDNSLFVIPSPDRGGAIRGLQFQFIADGVFDRGRSRTNRREAQIVAQSMIDHAQQRPELSLGVGTFSVAQRDLILDELELLRRAHPETEDFFSRSGEEPWFVKNLENIQGDERDTIFISVGYGRDESGFIAMNFGPLTAQGGERRLNVLISRAKQQCVVFSSIRGDDIDLRRTASRGAEALKTFLRYAESGQLDLSRPIGRSFDSGFEAQVADALRSFGWDVDTQVGVAGFFVDLAVIDPEVPGRYLSGIECDGAAYHSARWARDRDRLRQAVLEDHGWSIYRIWSTDWFHSRNEQLRKLLEWLESLRGGRQVAPQIEAIDIPNNSMSARDIHPHADLGNSSSHEGSAVIPRELTSDASENGSSTLPYVESQFHDPCMSREIHDLAPSELARVVTRIVETEGPVHVDEITRRVTTLWGLQRAGNRISTAVSQAISHAHQHGRIDKSDGFCSRFGQLTFPTRNRENVASTNLRKPEMLPPQELDAAVVEFVAAHVSATVDETARAISRQLGFRSTSQQLKSRIEARIDFLISAQKLLKDQDVLRVVIAAD